MTDSQPIVQLSNITKRYSRGGETIEVLRSVTLAIQSGDFLALMGPSGSGKSTLLNIIAGIDRADSGTVVVAGQDLTSVSSSQLAAWRAANIGFVFQFYNLIPVLTALENVALPLNLHHLGKKERLDRARFALDVVGLADRHNHFPRQLSGGQEQRVAIARAIVTDPRILVTDEPTGDLDRSSADDILKLLARLNREFHKTIVMVTHDQSAADHAQRIVHLDKGEVKG